MASSRSYCFRCKRFLTAFASPLSPQTVRSPKARLGRPGSNLLWYKVAILISMLLCYSPQFLNDKTLLEEDAGLLSVYERPWAPRRTNLPLGLPCAGHKHRRNISAGLRKKCRCGQQENAKGASDYLYYFFQSSALAFYRCRVRLEPALVVNSEAEPSLGVLDSLTSV